MAGMRFRKLRIAISAVCGVLCLLLIVLWVRSYTYGDIFAWRFSDWRQLFAQSYKGELTVSVRDTNVKWSRAFMVHE
jgi:hypothetical protein